MGDAQLWAGRAQLTRGTLAYAAHAASRRSWNCSVQSKWQKLKPSKLGTGYVSKGDFLKTDTVGGQEFTGFQWVQTVYENGNLCTASAGGLFENLWYFLTLFNTFRCSWSNVGSVMYIHWIRTLFKLSNWTIFAVALQKQRFELLVMDNLMRVENLNLTYRLHIHRIKYESAERFQSSTLYSINISTTEIGTYILEIFLDGIQVSWWNKF